MLIRACRKACILSVIGEVESYALRLCITVIRGKLARYFICYSVAICVQDFLISNLHTRNKTVVRVCIDSPGKVTEEKLLDSHVNSACVAKHARL